MKFRLVFLIYILLFPTLALQSQDIFQKGTIHLNNGDSIETYIKVYDYNILQSQGNFRHKQGGEIMKIEGASISTITLNTVIYEKLQSVKKGKNSNPRSNRSAPPDTTYFFATRLNDTEPKLYAHHRCNLLFTYNNGCNEDVNNYTTFLIITDKEIKKTNELYYSEAEDPEMAKTPHIFNKEHNTYIYFTKSTATSSQKNLGPGYHH